MPTAGEQVASTTAILCGVGLGVDCLSAWKPHWAQRCLYGLRQLVRIRYRVQGLQDVLQVTLAQAMREHFVLGGATWRRPLSACSRCWSFLLRWASGIPS